MVVGLWPRTGARSWSTAAIWQPILGAKRSIGFVPDNPNLYPRLTGLEYLNLIGDVYGVDGATRKRRLDYYLQMFELTSAVGI